MKHFLKKCEEFTLCGSLGDADTLFSHGYPDNHAIYHIIIKGNVKMARPFESKFVSFDVENNKFVDVKNYLYSKNQIAHFFRLRQPKDLRPSPLA